MAKNKLELDIEMTLTTKVVDAIEESVQRFKENAVSPGDGIHVILNSVARAMGYILASLCIVNRKTTTEGDLDKVIEGFKDMVKESADTFIKTMQAEEKRGQDNKPA